MSLVAKLLKGDNPSMDRRGFFRSITKDAAEDIGYAALTYSTINVLANAFSANNAYAQEPDLPEKLEGDPAFEYFDGGVYRWDSEDFPNERWNFNDDLSIKTGDLEKVFDPQKPLYDMIGKHFEKQYENGSLIAINYNEDNLKEFAITIEKNNEYIIGFKKLEPGMMKALKKYDDHIVH